ncbi:hypothetical protein F2Q69_00043468 [Brassica cretica]|uniref:Uncharacterized protein n=1 Tax=Brassica cretica TaxID=69181 RepID=A0A8S9NIS1_BRACR|nr:hypothetical protein F2Q69_00043468 [Brassica cretica]
MISLPPPASSRLLTLLAWQSTLYWIWNERNSRLHANNYRSIDTIFSQIDRQVRNKIQSFRESNPVRSSQMMQQWSQMSHRCHRSLPAVSVEAIWSHLR